MKILLTAMLDVERAAAAGDRVEAQTIVDWFDAAARSAGWPVMIVQATEYDPPAKPDPSLTEIGAPVAVTKATATATEGDER